MAKWGETGPLSRRYYFVDEAGKERYVEYLWSGFRLVQDIDDTRKAGYGAYYTQRKPLNAAALAWRK